MPAGTLPCSRATEAGPDGGEVDVAGVLGDFGGGLVDDHHQVHALEIGGLAREVGVALEHPALAQPVLDHPVGAAETAGGMACGDAPAGGLDRVLGDDRAGNVGQRDGPDRREGRSRWMMPLCVPVTSTWVKVPRSGLMRELFSSTMWRSSEYFTSSAVISPKPSDHIWPSFRRNSMVVGLVCSIALGQVELPVPFIAGHVLDQLAIDAAVEEFFQKARGVERIVIVGLQIGADVEPRSVRPGDDRGAAWPRRARWPRPEAGGGWRWGKGAWGSVGSSEAP
jgi:hypothetical protein